MLKFEKMFEEILNEDLFGGSVPPILKNNPTDDNNNEDETIDDRSTEISEIIDNMLNYLVNDISIKRQLYIMDLIEFNPKFETFENIYHKIDSNYISNEDDRFYDSNNNFNIIEFLKFTLESMKENILIVPSDLLSNGNMTDEEFNNVKQEFIQAFKGICPTYKGTAI